MSPEQERQQQGVEVGGGKKKKKNITNRYAKVVSALHKELWSKSGWHWEK